MAPDLGTDVERTALQPRVTSCRDVRERGDPSGRRASEVGRGDPRETAPQQPVGVLGTPARQRLDRGRRVHRRTLSKPVGILTVLIGGPYFMTLLLRVARAGFAT